MTKPQKRFTNCIHIHSSLIIKHSPLSLVVYEWVFFRECGFHFEAADIFWNSLVEIKSMMGNRPVSGTSTSLANAPIPATLPTRDDRPDGWVLNGLRKAPSPGLVPSPPANLPSNPASPRCCSCWYFRVTGGCIFTPRLQKKFTPSVALVSAFVITRNSIRLFNRGNWFFSLAGFSLEGFIFLGILVVLESLPRNSTEVPLAVLWGLASMSLVLRDIPRDCMASSGRRCDFLKVTRDFFTGFSLAKPKMVGCRAARISGDRLMGFLSGCFTDFCCIFGLVLPTLLTLDCSFFVLSGFVAAFIGDLCLDLGIISLFWLNKSQSLFRSVALSFFN